jgi:hypothetical protein
VPAPQSRADGSVPRRRARVCCAPATAKASCRPPVVAANLTAPVAVTLSDSRVVGGAIAASRGGGADAASVASFVFLNGTTFEDDGVNSTPSTDASAGESTPDLQVGGGAAVAVGVAPGQNVTVSGVNVTAGVPEGAAAQAMLPGLAFLEGDAAFVVDADSVRSA